MTKLLTPEELKLKFQREKEIRLRKKEREKRKQKEIYKKASEAVKKELDNKLSAIIKLTSQKQNKQPQIKPLTTYHVYNSNKIERYSAEEDLYTLYELQHIEELFPDEPGRINWKIWNYLVNKLKNK